VSLPTPYYDKDGITIYNAAIRVNCTHGRKRKSQKVSGEKARRICTEVATGSQAWVQAVTGSHCETNQGRRPASQLEGRRNNRAFWKVESLANVPGWAMFQVWCAEFRAAPHRRKYSKQQFREHCACLSEMSHGGGWSS